ncbi:hypothetical protein ACFL5N_01310, partial [bacterium]
MKNYLYLFQIIISLEVVFIYLKTKSFKSGLLCLLTSIVWIIFLFFSYLDSIYNLPLFFYLAVSLILAVTLIRFINKFFEIQDKNILFYKNIVLLLFILSLVFKGTILSFYFVYLLTFILLFSISYALDFRNSYLYKILVTYNFVGYVFLFITSGT